MFRFPDRAITFLLSFLKALLSSLVSFIPSCQPLSMILQSIPKSLQSLRQMFSSGNRSITEFVVCPKCSSLYKMSDCIEVKRGVSSSKACNYVAFPNHTQRRRRAPCGALLMKTIKFGSNCKLVPKIFFTYNSVTKALSSILCRKEAIQQCNEWKNYVNSDGFLNDIIDGQIWKEFRLKAGLQYLFCCVASRCVYK